MRPASAAVSLLGLVTVLLLAVNPTPVGAAFPGANGLIAFASDRSGSWELWTMDPDGSNETQLTHLPGSQMPAFSPTGNDIIFVRANAGLCGGASPCQVIYEKSSTSTNLIDWLVLPGLYRADNKQPAFSPQSYAASPGPETVTVWSSDSGDKGNANIYAQMRMRLCFCLRKNYPVQLTRARGGERRPSYSPDGRRILYDAVWPKGRDEVGPGLGEPNASARLVSLIHTKHLEAALAQTPIVPTITERPLVPTCLRPRAPGERPSNCTEETWAGTFSPDGERIAYTYEKRREPLGPADCRTCSNGRYQFVNRGIGMMNLDGGNVERVTEDECSTDRNARKYCPTEPFANQPAFSPDGHRLVYQVNRSGGNVDIWSVDVDSCKGGGGSSPCGRSPKQLTSKGRNAQPDWGPKPQP